MEIESPRIIQLVDALEALPVLDDSDVVENTEEENVIEKIIQFRSEQGLFEKQFAEQVYSKYAQAHHIMGSPDLI